MKAMLLEDMMGAANSAPLILYLLSKLEHHSYGTESKHSFPWQSLKASQCIIELPVSQEIDHLSNRQFFKILVAPSFAPYCRSI